jgi:pyrimidine-specific ribonucleoside hydrolase
MKMKYAIWFCCLCVWAVSAQAQRRAVWPAVWPAVWIDTDPSVVGGGKEVDDGFALIQAFHSPELHIRGVSVVFGNADFPIAWPNGQEIVRRFGPKGLKIYPGADSAAKLGVETEASRALAAALKKERLILIALGPVTNVATIVKNHPELHKQISEIVAVAGRRAGQRFVARADQPRGFRDFNFELDAPGFQVLLDSQIPLTLAPWEVSSHVWLKAEDIERFKQGNAATKYMVKPATDWLARWQKDLGLDGFNPFDTLAIAWVTHPQLLKWEALPIEIQTLPDDTQLPKPGETVKQKPYLIVSAKHTTKRKARYCYEPLPQFKPLLMERLLRKP